MVFYSLRVGNFFVKYTPLKSREIDFPLCDKDGKPLKRVVEGKGTAYFIDDNGNKSESSFRLINGKPMAKLSRTTEVSTYKEVGNEEVEDLLTEKCYYVDCDLLLQELQDSNRALKFGFTFGNGFKVYKAYIHTSKLYPNCLFMSCGTTQKSEVLSEIAEIKKQSKKAQQIDLTISGIERAKVEDLIQI